MNALRSAALKGRVRLLCTTRSDPHVLGRFKWPNPLTDTTEIPADTKASRFEVRRYIRKRLNITAYSPTLANSSPYDSDDSDNSDPNGDSDGPMMLTPGVHRYHKTVAGLVVS